MGFRSNFEKMIWAPHMREMITECQGLVVRLVKDKLSKRNLFVIIETYCCLAKRLWMIQNVFVVETQEMMQPRDAFKNVLADFFCCICICLCICLCVCVCICIVLDPAWRIPYSESFCHHLFKNISHHRCLNFSLHLSLSLYLSLFFFVFVSS